MARMGAARPVVVYGPACDSLDRLRDPLDLPPVEEGDTLLFAAMGAYVSGVDTRFNGYGARHTVRVMALANETAAYPTTRGSRAPGRITAGS